MTRTEFLKEQTVSAKNKICRTPIPKVSVSDAKCSLPERKAMALAWIFENMPVFIGEKELIVGTRTFYRANAGNEDGHDVFAYSLDTKIPYVNEQELARFGVDKSYLNKTHYTPDFAIILDKGIDGILNEAEERKNDASLHAVNIDFLNSVIVAYKGLKTLIIRYRDEALRLAESASGDDKNDLLKIAGVCKKISAEPPETFHEAIQLLWFAHLGTIIESFCFINYGRLDVILNKFLRDTPREEAEQLIECLLLKMYDQADLATSYLNKYSGQLVVTLGGVLSSGESAVSEVTMMFLNAIDKIRLPEPEFNLRISRNNPPEFLDKAAELTISGCNQVSYYNDDLFVESLHRAGIPIENAREYGFDLCQDINIPGKGDFWLAGSLGLAAFFMEMLKAKRDFGSFEELLAEFKSRIAKEIERKLKIYNLGQSRIENFAKGNPEVYFDGVKNHGWGVQAGAIAPLPYLSALFHGTIDKALDVTLHPYMLQEKGFFFGTSVETVNSLAAIKKIVFDEKRYTLGEVYAACENDFAGEDGLLLKSLLWNAPKWGNDDDYVDSIAKELLEFCLTECKKYKTHFGGQILGGIHQPHPIPAGAKIMATPEGRNAYTPVAVTLTPESGTMKNGPTAALKSAAKIDPSLVQWNYCVMVNYFASVFKGNNGKEIFKTLLCEYFGIGGLQHQPNVMDASVMKQAQLEPDKYKDLIVRLWGVSAHFVDLPKELQDEMIARFI
ncbi:MAG: hypothetical protein IJ002_08505 [Clostridia bacterium]|nr:hypothetical protein [Clostridia bacterium]